MKKLSVLCVGCAQFWHWQVVVLLRESAYQEGFREGSAAGSRLQLLRNQLLLLWRQLLLLSQQIQRLITLLFVRRMLTSLWVQVSANYSVVVGSFSLKANAEGLANTLKSAGYEAQIVFNSARNMYRVVASTFADKSGAVKSRNRAPCWQVS